jgi:hypothetical protein
MENDRSACRQPKSSPWIQSPLWDGFWMFSGVWAPALSILIYVALRLAAGDHTAGEAPAYDLSQIAVLYIPLSIMHRIATTYSVLGTPLLREDIRARKGHYIYLPMAITAGCVALGLCFSFHSLFAFMPSAHAQLWGFFALAYVMIVWERWHFCAQEFGVLSIYRIRARQAAPADKAFDRLYTVVLMLGVTMTLFLCLGFESTRVLLHGTPLIDYQGPLLRVIALIAFSLGMGMFGYGLLREWRHPQRSIPKLLFYGLIGVHTLLLYVYPKAGGLFFLTYTLHHWMVAVGLFGRVSLNSYPGASRLGAFAKLARGFGPVLVLCVLWYLFFGVLDTAGNLTPVPTPQAFEGASVAAKLLAGVIIGLFFALNYLHYYYDRCFYAFSNPVIRKTVGPLLLGRSPADAPSPRPQANPIVSDRAAAMRLVP